MITTTRTGHPTVSIEAETPADLNRAYAANARTAATQGHYRESRDWANLITVPAFRLKVLVELADLYRERREA